MPFLFQAAASDSLLPHEGLCTVHLEASLGKGEQSETWIAYVQGLEVSFYDLVTSQQETQEGSVWGGKRGTV